VWFEKIAISKHINKNTIFKNIVKYLVKLRLSF
jgi:hypothetical protein